MRKEEMTKFLEGLNNSDMESLLKIWGQYKNARDDFERDYNLFSGMTTTFQEQLHYLMNKKDFTEEALAEAVDISTRTLSRYSNGHNAPSMQTLISICIVLGLDIKQSASLLTSLGFCFLGSSREHYAYMYLIDRYRGETLEKCNQILTELGIDKKYHLYPRKKKK